MAFRPNSSRKYSAENRPMVDEWVRVIPPPPILPTLAALLVCGGVGYAGILFGITPAASAAIGKLPSLNQNSFSSGTFTAGPVAIKLLGSEPKVPYPGDLFKATFEVKVPNGYSLKDFVVEVAKPGPSLQKGKFEPTPSDGSGEFRLYRVVQPVTFKQVYENATLTFFATAEKDFVSGSDNGAKPLISQPLTATVTIFSRPVLIPPKVITHGAGTGGGHHSGSGHSGSGTSGSGSGGSSIAGSSSSTYGH